MSYIMHLQVFIVGHRISWPRLKTAVNDHPPHPGVLLLGPEVLGYLPFSVGQVISASLHRKRAKYKVWQIHQNKWEPVAATPAWQLPQVV